MGARAEGCKAAYVSYYPDLAAPGAAEAIGSFAEMAVNSGTRRLVMLSGRGEDEAVACEKALTDSGADWTVLRCSWFNQNFSENYLLEPVLSGHVVLPAGAVGEPFVDADDIADVAAAALTEDGHSGQLYELTGPRLLTFADAVAEIAAATGRPIGYTPVPAAVLRGGPGGRGRPRRGHRAADLPVHHGAGWPQRPPGRRRPACPGPVRPRLRRLRARRRRGRRLEPGVTAGPRTGTTAALLTTAITHGGRHGRPHPVRTPT